MNPEGRARVEAWLEYFNDLEISDFCLDRAASTVEASSAPVEPILAVPDPLPRPVRVAPAVVNPNPTHVASVLPVIKSASLFAANERVEGDTLDRIREDIGENCRRCKLCEQRSKIVFGAGHPKAELVFRRRRSWARRRYSGPPFRRPRRETFDADDRSDGFAPRRRLHRQRRESVGLRRIARLSPTKSRPARRFSTASSP